MSGLLEGLRQFLHDHPAGHYWIGYSGGVDSHVLLHLCARLRHELGDVFHAVHINHHIHPESGRWQRHCQEICRALGLPFHAISVDGMATGGESPEEAARKARYQAFAQLLQPAQALLLAQHQDDQAETVLLQLLRGAGPAGLAGMAVEAPLGEGRLLRPLLEVSKQALLAYAQAQNLDWIEDPSNAQTDFDRNYLRHRVLPLLARRWPACARTISRSARHCAAAEKLLASALQPQLFDMLDDAGSIDLEQLRQLDPPQQAYILRAWLKQMGLPLPSEAYLQRILSEVVTAKDDRMPVVGWKGAEVRRYRNRLYAQPPQPEHDASWRQTWNGMAPLQLPDGTWLESRHAVGRGMAKHWLRRGDIEVAYRQGGERCLLPGRQGRHPLKKLFQERGVPPWLRQRLPLLYIRGQLAAVVPFWVCQPFAAEVGEESVVFRWSGFVRDAESVQANRGVVA
ncbi:MAG TPA: tRNA lysidine(34) synthetase TilS [Methylothermaceae bacterium]|nr:tRNA lysidine(34) synthetase TilS [Methylothermaceae bacterium]